MSRARQKLLQKHLRDKDRQIADKDSEIMQLRSQLDAKDRTVQELSDNVNELQLRLNQSESLLSKHDVPQDAGLHTANQTQVITHAIVIEPC